MAAKRFGGIGAAGTGGKFAAISAAVTSDLGDVSRQLERPVDRTRGVFERIAMETVRPDPDNPRNLNLTWEELEAGISQLQSDEGASRTPRMKIYESILNRANSFKKIGQLQPIVVYRDDRSMLRIIDGESRYWSARVAGWTEIEAKIKPTRPKYLRIEQHAANALRDDLTLSAYFKNLEMIMTESEGEGTPIRSLTEFAAALQRPRTTVQQWWSILRGPYEDVKAAIRDGAVTSLETAYTATQEPDPSRRAALLQGQALPARNVAPKPTTAPRSRGRRKSIVELGRISDLETVRQLIAAVPVEVQLDGTDWSDPKAVQKAWKQFLDAFTRHIQPKAAARSQ